MGKRINFIKSNLRYAKYQVIVVALLFVVAAMLINMFLFLSLNYNGSYALEKDRLNGEDIDILLFDNIPVSPKNDLLDEVLSDIPEIKNFEVDDVVANSGTVDFKDGKLTRSITCMSLSHAEEKQIGKYEILESDGGSGAYLSYLFKADGGFQIGDEVTVTLGVHTDSFRVAGFYHNVDTGTANCSDIAILLTDDCYKEVEAYGIRGYRVSVLLEDPGSADLIESKIVRKVHDAAPMLTALRSSTAIRIASTRYVTSTLFQAIISIASVLMIAVLLAIIAITLSNYIRNNMRNLGALKAIGYTSDLLIWPIVAEFSVIAAVTSVVGVAVSYLILPVLNTALEKQSGIPYQIRFMFPEALVSVVICVLAAAVTTFLSVAAIRRIPPIAAIREGKKQNRARKNYFALDKTRLDLNTAISLKTWISSKSRNAVIFFSIAGISFLLGFSCSVYQNIVVDSSKAMSLVFGNMADSVVSAAAANEEALVQELEQNGAVSRYFMLTTNTLTPDGLPKLYAFVFDDAGYFEDKETCFEGHLPENENEIAVNGAYAAKNGLSIGDVLRFSDDDVSNEYTICGFTQGAESSGYDCYMRRQSYEKMSPMLTVSYYIDLKDGEDIDRFNEDLAQSCRLLYHTNYREMADTVSKSYMNVLSLATVIVVLVSILIAGFILYIVISVYLSNRKRDHGIQKSLGFVTKDIIYQTVVSIIPTSIVAVAIGLWISRKGSTELLIMAVRGIGIFSFGSPTSVLLLLAAGIGIVAFTVVYAVLLSGSVRRITPHQLFNNE